MSELDKELYTIREFLQFAFDVAGKNKAIKAMHKIFCGKKKLTDFQINAVKKSFVTCFTNVVGNLTAKNFIQFKAHVINLAVLERICSANEEDTEAFAEYIKTFQTIYFDLNKNMYEFIEKLDMDPESAEARFLLGLINDIGGEFLDTIKSGGNLTDVASILPKIMQLVQNGKIAKAFERITDGEIKFSKILFAIAKLVEQYEGEEGGVAVEGGEVVVEAGGVAVVEEEAQDESDSDETIEEIGPLAIED